MKSIKCQMNSFSNTGILGGKVFLTGVQPRQDERERGARPGETFKVLTGICLSPKVVVGIRGKKGVFPEFCIISPSEVSLSIQE